MSLKSLTSSDFGHVLADLCMTCLDIGARDGFTTDLLPLAPSVDAYGFEPDPEECDRLNQAAAKSSLPWRGLKFIPTALGRAQETRTLNLYRRRGCSSLLHADAELAKAFARDHYYELDDTIEVPTMPLDAAAIAYDFTDAVYMKIDVQGAELEVLASGTQLLRDSLLVIRSEVSFLTLYQGQPLFCEIDSYLRDYGFVPMEFLELHHWRRTRQKHPNLGDGPIPYSRGQIVHGDILYFKDPALITENSLQEIQTLLKAAFLAIAYEHIDYAAALLNRHAVTEFLHSTYGLHIEKALGEISHGLACDQRAKWCRMWQAAKAFLR